MLWYYYYRRHEPIYVGSATHPQTTVTPPALPKPELELSSPLILFAGLLCPTAQDSLANHRQSFKKATTPPLRTKRATCYI